MDATHANLLKPEADLKTAAVLEAVQTAAVDAIVVIDGDGVIRQFNPAACRMFQYQPEEVLGRNVSLLMPAPHQARHDEYIARYRRTGEPHIIGKGRRVQARRKDGSRFPVQLSVTEVPLGDQVWFAGVMSDMTEQVTLQQAVVDRSEAERAQIGQELHDVLAQQLTALSLLSRALEKEIEKDEGPGLAAAREISELSRKAMEEARMLSHGLFPTELIKRGVVSALRQLCGNQARLWGVACRLRAEPELIDLEPSVAMHLYRITQEAMMNSVKHGQATQLDVVLRVGESLHLTVKDNGTGFDGRPGEGIGLSIMDYRAKLMGGVFDITARSERGCRVDVVVPA